MSSESTVSFLNKFSLDDHVAVVTGASRGIGRGIAEAFSEAGAIVVANARDPETLAKMAQEVSAKTGNQVIDLAGDIGDEEFRLELLETAMKIKGRLDILVNNAGGSGPNKAVSTTADQFSDTLTWNVVPAFDLSARAQPMMQDSRNAVIINISSAAARHKQKNFSSYGSAKAALSHLTRQLAQEFAPNVRVNAIEPGAIMTEALEGFMHEKMKQKILDSTPMARFGVVEDVAAAALFLASPASSWITGKILEVDGGVENPVW